MAACTVLGLLAVTGEASESTANEPTVELVLTGSDAARVAEGRGDSLAEALENVLARTMGHRFRVVLRTEPGALIADGRCRSKHVGHALRARVCVDVGAETPAGDRPFDIRITAPDVALQLPTAVLAVEMLPLTLASLLVGTLGRRAFDLSRLPQPLRRPSRHAGAVTMSARVDGGRVSVDGNAFQSLPVRLPADDAIHTVTVDLTACGLATHELTFDQKHIEWSCVEPGVVLRLDATQKTTAQLVVDGRKQPDIPLTPGKTHVLRLGSGAESLQLACKAPGQVRWKRAFALTEAIDTLKVTCTPWPAQRVVRLWSDAPDTVYRVDEQFLRRPLPAPADLYFGDPIEDPGPLQADRWYVTTDIEPGLHRICASARGFGEQCEFLDSRTAPGPHSLVFHLPARPEPEPAPDLPTVETSTAGARGRLSVGLGGGMTHKHRRWFSAIGPLARFTFDARPMCLDDYARRCLVLETGLMFEWTERPVFLTRYGSALHTTRGHLAMRWEPWLTSIRPSLAIGGFASPEIAIGPWVALGTTAPLGAIEIDLDLGIPIFVDDRQGHFGFELRLGTRFSLPDGG